jgi:(4S)-4-hydroxy-5-phosphonooxypentane-2,3-dione isomerase
MKFGATTPFLLIARCHVKPSCIDKYIEAAKVADAAVKETEPDMLHHTFDQDPNDKFAFVWSEVYKDDASLLFHLTNPALVKFVQEHGEYGDDFSIEVYGTLADETKAAFTASGFPIKYFDTMFGYSRFLALDSVQKTSIMPIEPNPGQLLGPTLGISMGTWTAAYEAAYQLPSSSSEPAVAAARGEPAEEEDWVTIDGFSTPAVDVTDRRFMADPAFPPDKLGLWSAIPVEHDGWVRAHNAVRHELSQFKSALSQSAAGALEGWQVTAIKTYVQGHLVHVHEHHSNEDDVFNPALRKRVVYPEKLEADHVQLVELMDAVEKATAELKVGSSVAALLELWTRYEALMLPHLHEEEVVGLPLARAYFAPKEIGKIVESFMRNGDLTSMGGFVHAMGSKKAVLEFMAENGIPSFVWHLPSVGWKALRARYRAKMQSHVDSLIAGKVVSSVHKPKGGGKAATMALPDENATAQSLSPAKP